MVMLGILYYVILAIAFSIGIVRFKRLTIPFKLLTASVLVMIILEILARVCGRIYQNNAPELYLESVLGYIFYALVYFYFFRNLGFKKAIILSIFCIVLFSIINGIFLQDPFQKKFPTNVFLITNLLYVLFSLLMFKQMLQYPLSVNITKQSIFWFNTAMLFFATTMFLTMGLTNYYATHHWGYDIVYNIWVGNFCLFNGLICVSLLTDSKERSTSYGH